MRWESGYYLACFTFSLPVAFVWWPSLLLSGLLFCILVFNIMADASLEQEEKRKIGEDGELQ